MTQPYGFVEGDASLVCKLHKALYGLKQAPRAWFQRLQSALCNMGFHSAKCDTFLLPLHIPVTSNSSSSINDMVSNLNSQFPLEDLGDLNYFLGIQVAHTTSGAITLTQTKYIHDILRKANMQNAKPMKTPMFMVRDPTQ
ncbi:hypothetical protein CR513_43941, partial [Mucuna pruriens]